MGFAGKELKWPSWAILTWGLSQDCSQSMVRAGVILEASLFTCLVPGLGRQSAEGLELLGLPQHLLPPPGPSLRGPPAHLYFLHGDQGSKGTCPERETGASVSVLLIWPWKSHSITSHCLLFTRSEWPLPTIINRRWIRPLFLWKECQQLWICFKKHYSIWNAWSSINGGKFYFVFIKV